MKPKVSSINKLLGMQLVVPDYQRPYKWTHKNITDLILDTQKSIEESRKYTNFKYRVGTVILHKNKKDEYEIVDGQQRILSFLLLNLYLDPEFECDLLKIKFLNKITQKNLHDNYTTIRKWFSSVDDTEKAIFNNALKNILEVVVITVDKIDEAFQLFDSQNTRGKELDPHDLLKAYHLREMKHYPYEMEHAVTKWEAKDTTQIRDLFDMYLFPIWNWSRGIKSRNFTAKEIDTYKGIVETSTYTYARRASKAMPYFQITEPFIAGNDFFEMVDHYLCLLRDIKAEICNNPKFNDIKLVICGGKNVSSAQEMDQLKFGSAGFSYTRNLFYCALLCYYDKFHNFDEMAVKKLFTWALMVRVDMENLGFDSINKYAIGDRLLAIGDEVIAAQEKTLAELQANL